MDIVYRPMHLSDIPKVWELLEILKNEKAGVSLIDVPGQQDVKKWLESPNTFLYIAVDGENVAGLLRGIRGAESGKRHAAILSIAIHPSYRNQGIAKELTGFGLEDMKKDGVTLARVYIYSDNLPSVNTALRLGFTFSGAVHRHHYKESTGEYVDDLIFHKLL